MMYMDSPKASGRVRDALIQQSIGDIEGRR